MVYLFKLLSTVLLSVSIYANSVSIVSTSVLGGLIFCGVFLFVIALVGLIGTLKHHQVLLFFVRLIINPYSYLKSCSLII